MQVLLLPNGHDILGHRTGLWRWVGVSWPLNPARWLWGSGRRSKVRSCQTVGRCDQGDCKAGQKLTMVWSGCECGFVTPSTQEMRLTLVWAVWQNGHFNRWASGGHPVASPVRLRVLTCIPRLHLRIGKCIIFTCTHKNLLKCRHFLLLVSKRAKQQVSYLVLDCQRKPMLASRVKPHAPIMAAYNSECT